MKVRSLTSQSYWKKQTGCLPAFMVEDNPFGAILKKYLPFDKKMSCVEIGAYPGGNLCYLAKRFGYMPYAIEYRDDADDIRRLFEFNGIEAPEIIQGDFLALEPRSFDVVASFGFVEHFNDAPAVIRKHVEFLKPGGYLVLSVPHFWGMQGFFRHLVFSDAALAELYETHNLDFMHLGKIKKTFRLSDIDIFYAGYAMGGKFWISPDSYKVRNDRKWLAKVLARFDKYIGQQLPSCALFSPMMLVIGRKKATHEFCG